MTTNNEISIGIYTFEKDFLFFQKELDNLRKKFMNKYVAIHNKNLVGVGSTIEELEKELSKKDLDISKIVVEFVPEEENIMIL